jgi:hypothetical protein
VLALILLSSASLLLDRAARLGAVLLGLTLVTTMLWEQQTYSNHWVLVATVSLLFALVPRPDASRTVPYWPVFLVRCSWRRCTCGPPSPSSTRSTSPAAR